MTEYAKLVLAVDSTQSDNASKSLDRLNSGSEKVESAVKHLTEVMQRGFMLSAAATNNVASSVADLNIETQKLEKTTKDATNNMATGFKSLIGVVAAYLSVNQVAQYADAYTNLNNRLNLVTDSSMALAVAQGHVFDIAQRSRQDLGATGDLYFKISQNADRLGLSMTDVAGVTETITKTLALSGASAQSSSAAILQLSQALASGAIRGDEFNSVAENAPALMDALARALNVTKGELRDLAADGRLTADVLIAAFKEQADEVEAAFEKTDSTIGQSFQRLSNATTMFIGKASEATGAIKLVTAAVDDVTDAFTGNESAIKDTAIIVGSAAVAYGAATVAINAKAMALRAAAAAQLLFNRAVSANPYVLAATAIAGLAAAFVTFNRDSQPAIQSAAEFDAQLASMTGNTKALAEAQRSLKLEKIADEIRSRTEQIAQINADAANANAKLGLAETQRIQELQRQLAMLGQAYQEVKNQGESAAAPIAKTAAQLLAANQGTAKEKTAKASVEKDNFDYGAAGFSFNKLDAMAAEEEASAAAYTAARMERLNTQFMTEREAELLRYQQQMEDFQFYAEQKALAEDEVNRRIEDMQLVHGQNMAAIASKNGNSVLLQTLTGLQGIAGAFAGHSKTMFKVMKAASIAQGLLSIKTGIANAMALPFPANLAAAATVAAQGAGIMADIRSLTDSGGGKGISAPSGGGSVVMQPPMSGGSAVINQTQPARQQSVDIRLTGIRPDDMISGTYLQKIIEGIGETLSNNGARMGNVELVTA